MTTAAQLAAEVRTAIADQPYTVVDETPEGFSMHIDVVDARWWSLFHRNGLKKTWRWDVKVKDGGTYSVTDKAAEVRWQAGADVGGGVPRPTLKFAAEFSGGTAVQVSKQKVWAFDDSGRFTNVVDYSFDSREGNELINTVAQRMGLRRTMNTRAKIALYVAVFAAVGTALGGLWALVLALTGNLG
ncbi:hypothetical protein GCM10009737_00490 [Nocardioides lentus]|uniref:Uncharacterized protein n=1 Tax=Nocardioides lentus TaxID=338077 RepID=A0ABN2NUN9_9ACTN